MPGQHDFDRLRALAALGDEELGKRIDADSVATMQRVMVMLGADSRASGFPGDRADFIATVREMDGLCRESSRSLGEAIAEASAWGEKKDRERARAVYERFLSVCRSRFHREIARYQLRRLGAAGG